MLCTNPARLEQSCFPGSKTLSLPAPPPHRAVAVVLWRKRRHEPRATRHPHSLLPEDLVAPIALDSASSGLLYLDDHGAVCTRAQLKLIMTLWTQQGETMRWSPNPASNLDVPGCSNTFYSSSWWFTSRGYGNSRWMSWRPGMRQILKTFQCLVKPGSNSLEWSRIRVQNGIQNCICEMKMQSNLISWETQRPSGMYQRQQTAQGRRHCSPCSMCVSRPRPSNNPV